MAKNKSIKFVFEKSTNIEANGKCEIKVRINVTRTNRPRLKTGIYINPSLMLSEDGEIYTDEKSLRSEMIKATAEVNQYRAKVENIVIETTEAAQKGRFSGEVSKDWIEKALKIENLDLIEASFNEIKAEIDRAESEAKKAVEVLEQAEAQANKKTFYQYIEEYGRKVSKGRQTLYRSTARLLMRFELYQKWIEGNIDFEIDPDTLTKKDIENFLQYASDEVELIKAYSKTYKTIIEEVNRQIPVKVEKVIKERGKNYIIDIFREIGCVQRWLYDTGITNNNPFRGFKVSAQVYGTPYYLTKDERDIIANFDLSNYPKHSGLELATIRDIFIFQCYVGTRYGDLCTLTSRNIVDDMLIYTPSKTALHSNRQDPRVPLLDKAKELIERYKGVSKDGRLFPVPSCTTYNEAIKKIVEVCGVNRVVSVRDAVTGKPQYLPIYEVASSHMARRTFVGNMYEDIPDPNIIGSMSGHAEGSKAFSRYRTISDEQRKKAIEALK